MPEGRSGRTWRSCAVLRERASAGATRGQPDPPRRRETLSDGRPLVEPSRLGWLQAIWPSEPLLIPRSKVRILHGPLDLQRICSERVAAAGPRAYSGSTPLRNERGGPPPRRQEELPELATATERAPAALHVSDIGFCFRRKDTGVGSDRSRAGVVGSKSKLSGAEPVEERTEVASASDHVRVWIRWIDPQRTSGCRHQLQDTDSPST